MPHNLQEFIPGGRLIFKIFDFQMSWASDLPGELLCRPMGLVVLTGLDTTYNAIHKSIWDSFCNNRRSDRVPLNFIALGADHEYPKSKAKKTSYEWYVPKGILKSNWMNKHLNQIPAVVVVFFDLDWDEQLWKERQMECATRLEIVRNSLSGRSSRVCVVLIQKNSPLPPGEDVIAAERAASFCSACELSAKSLFVLPHTDHLFGYTIRLENAFYEQAQSYYHTEARRVKAHKEFLNKTTHQLLYVRHQFKIAFYNELKQDTHTAIKNYKQAYGHILELRMHNTNLLELKTVAGFINYKICRLSFQHNAPLDAIGQFRKHIDFFKKKIGIGELSFEHSAWMSKQFQVFGDLFDEAIKLGLTAIQTQHPGFYFQQAGNHAVARKQLCIGLCHPHAVYPTPDPLENLNNLDYYGQRSWRQGHQSIDPPDALREKDGIQALQILESKVDHSWIIIPLLSSAVAQFKKYKSPRMKRYLMVQMGEEYYHAKEYNKALALLNRVTYEYRIERWWPLLTSILITSLRCAYLVGSVQDYVTICLELMGKYVPLSPEEKTRIQMNLIRVISNDPPEPEPGCDTDCVEKAKPLWRVENIATQEPCVFTVEMQNIVSFVECKAGFKQTAFTADNPVELQVFLRTNCPFPIRFSKLAVLLNNQIYNEKCILTDGKSITSAESSTAHEGNLYLIPGKHRVYTFQFLASSQDVDNEIEISSVALELGSENSRCAILHWLNWQGIGGDPLDTMQAEQSKGDRKKKVDQDTDPEHIRWEDLEVSSTARIVPRKSFLDITLQHNPPCLVNEFYAVTVDIQNNEKTVITDVRLQIGLRESENQDSIQEQSTHVTFEDPQYDGKPVPRRTTEVKEKLEPGEKVSKKSFLKCMHQSTRNILVKVTYTIEVPYADQSLLCQCVNEESFSLNALPPFEVSVKMNSMKFETVESVHADEPFLLLTDIKSVSPWPVEIQNSELKLSAFAQLVNDPFQSQLESVSLNQSEVAGECVCLMAPLPIQPTVPMGTYTLHWKRKTEENGLPYVTTTLALPSVNVEHIPLYVDLDMPSHGCVRSTLPITYTIYNRTGYVQEIEITMDSSEVFMFAGHKQLHFRILPSSKFKLNFNLYPLIPGSVPLPKLHLNMLRYPGTMDEIVQKMLPSHVFIMPPSKHNREAITV